MASKRTRRTRWLSVLAAGAVAMMTVGLGQVGGTAASNIDTATANNVTLSSGNFYPTPLASIAACSVDYLLSGWWRGNMSWNAPTAPPSLGSSYTYRVVMVEKGNPSNVIYDEVHTDRSAWIENNWGRRGKTFLVNIYTMNGPSQSTGFISQGFSMQPGGQNVKECEAGSPQANGAGEDTNQWFSPPAGRGVSPGLTVHRPGSGDEQAVDAESSTPAIADGETPTASAESSAPSSGATSSSSATSTSPPPTTPATTPPTPTTTTTPTPTPTASAVPQVDKPVLTNSLVAPSGAVTAGTSTDGTSALLVDRKGELLAQGAVEPGSTLTWEGGQDVLWIIGKDRVSRIAKSPQDGTWKFYIDGGALPPGMG